MSTKTTFKRIALVAAASLGMGLLTVVPSQAAIVTDSMSVTATNGVAVSTGGKSDTGNSTVATVTVKFAASTATDTAHVSFIADAKPTGAADQYIRISGTADSTSLSTIDTSASTGVTVVSGKMGNTTDLKRVKMGTSASDTIGITAAANTTAAATFQVFMDSTIGTRTAGTYTFRAVVQFFTYGAAAFASEKTATFTITVAARTEDAKTADPANSTAYMSTTSGSPSSDAIPSCSATSSLTPCGFIEVKLRNASSATADESVTVTTTLGSVGVSGGTFGRSVILAYSGTTATDSMVVWLRPDGSSGTATITVTTPSVTFTPKSAVFYGSITGGSIVGTQRASTIKVGSNASAITVVAKDSSGNLYGSSTALFVYSDAVSVVDTLTSCSFDSTNQRHNCTVTGLAPGTANVVVGNSTKSVVSATFAVTVSSVSPATAKIAFDKASYAPGEKGYVIVSAQDSAGKNVAGSFTNLLATGGISTTANLGSIGGGISTSDSLSTGSVSPTLAWTTSTAGYASLEPIYLIPFYAPQTSGTITITATGGTALPSAGRVAITATAKVSDSAGEALAAVTALASQVAAFITKINAQITTLTDLVMKIQKKVKA